MQSPQSQTACSVTDLDGWFAGDVRDEEVHGDVLAVNVFVHHIPNSLGHHIGVQVRVVLREDKDKGKYVNDMLQPDVNLPCSRFHFLTLWKKAAPVRTMESSQE